MPAKEQNFTADFLRSVLKYNEDSGIFIWLYRSDCPKYWNTRYVGKQAGSVYGNGGIYIPIFKRDYKASRLAWLWMTGQWPTDLIDHIDCNPSNNKWTNLREATKQQNQRNQKLRFNSKSGYKGVTIHKPTGKWRVAIGHDGQYISLGYYFTKEEAHQAYIKAATKLHGEFARY